MDKSFFWIFLHKVYDVIQTIEMNIVMSLYKSFSTEHIQNIMTLEESVQHVVMTAIQEVGDS